jgi:hypothetical protein
VIKPAREFLWDRARSLSRRAHFEHRPQLFLQAADIYRDIVSTREDAYSWHYLGYNLDHAGEDRKSVESAFKKAVSLERDNTWWNSRLVTFLIHQARYVDAEREYREACERLHADEPTDPEHLAVHFLRWIAKAWLDVAEVRRARQVIDLVSLNDLTSEGRKKFEPLLAALADAEEARLLKESVHPRNMPADERWRDEPGWVEIENEEGSQLRDWFPGRVVEATPDGVSLVVATRGAPDDRRLVKRQATRAEWLEWSGVPPERVDGWFIEVGRYEDGTTRVRHVLKQHHWPALEEFDFDDAIRYGRQWG